MTLYIYANVITLDTDYMDDYLFEHFAKNYKNIDTVDSKVEWAWQDDVEKIENVTIEQVMEYVNDCYRMLEYNWAYKEV